MHAILTDAISIFMLGIFQIVNKVPSSAPLSIKLHFMKFPPNKAVLIAIYTRIIILIVTGLHCASSDLVGTGGSHLGFAKEKEF